MLICKTQLKREWQAKHHSPFFFFQLNVEQQGVWWTLLIFLFPEITQTAHYCPEPCHLTLRACFGPAGQNRQLVCVVIYLFARRETARSASSWPARTYQSAPVDLGTMYGSGGWNPIIWAGMCQVVLQTLYKVIEFSWATASQLGLSSRHSVGDAAIAPSCRRRRCCCCIAEVNWTPGPEACIQTHHAHTLSRLHPDKQTVQAITIQSDRG